MIPKIQARGSSFKGLATYLTHDPKEKTDKRVDWTHTLNLAHDHIPSAVDEMLWTARAAELLKQEAGIRAGGRATEDVVKHFSLNWSPEDDPNREQMIEATEAFLCHMKWNEHQAVLVAHNDKDYAHVHVMLNAIHPETGLRLNESFEHRRAQAWALEYEREHGRIYCEQRLKDVREREDGPTRPAWMAFKESQIKFERDEKSLCENESISPNELNYPDLIRSAEWKKLKEIQRHERESFFAEGKLAFSELRRSIYGEVRAEFRERWADFYADQKKGGSSEALAHAKAELLAEQKAMLDGRRDEACKELRKERDGFYRELLGDQRDIRHQMRWRQEAGLENAVFLQLIGERDPGKDRQRPAFDDAANETVAQQNEERSWALPAMAGPERRPRGTKSAVEASTSIATGLGFGLLSIFGSIADGLIGSKPELKQREPEPIRQADLFDVAADDARKREQHEREDAESEWRKRQRSYGE
jgi:hypothetical protein